MTEPITINALLRQGDITGFDDAEVVEDEENKEDKNENT